MTYVHQPTAKDVRELLSGLVGREVSVQAGAEVLSVDTPGGLLVGTYVDRLGTLRAVAVTNLPAAACLGTSIALMPPGRAAEAVGTNVLDSDLAENTAEVLNVMASLFNVDEAMHLRLDKWYEPGVLLPPAVAPWVTAWIDRLNLTIDVKGYGTGYLSIASGMNS